MNKPNAPLGSNITPAQFGNWLLSAKNSPRRHSDEEIMQIITKGEKLREEMKKAIKN